LKTKIGAKVTNIDRAVISRWE